MLELSTTMCSINIWETGIIHLIQLSDAGKAGQEQEPGGLTDLCTLPAKDQLQDTWSEVCSCLTYLTLPVHSFNENTFNFTFKQFLNPWWLCRAEFLVHCERRRGSIWKDCWHCRLCLPISACLSAPSSLSDDYHFWIICYGSLSICNAETKAEGRRKDGWKDGGNIESGYGKRKHTVFILMKRLV